MAGCVSTVLAGFLLAPMLGSGSLVLIAGNQPRNTEVASLKILKYIEGDQQAAAASVAVLLLLVAVVVIVALDIISRRVAARG